VLGTALIVFREVLEAALIIGIVAAATRGIAGRDLRLVQGVALGVAGSCAVAFGAEAIGSLADGMGQEIFNASILLIAVAMLAWHNVWMAQQGREMASSAGDVGRAIRSGARPLSAVMVVVALSVLREGSETVLFLHGVSMSGGSSAGGMLAGGLLGLAGGMLVGGTLYAGLLRIPLQWFFRATSALVLLLAAGMAAQAARFLVQADVLPDLVTPVWDTSQLVPNDSAVGSVLRGLVGYEAQPAGIQVVFFVFVLFAITAGMAWTGRRNLSASS
jgi:high-affinity iron transporter